MKDEDLPEGKQTPNGHTGGGKKTLQARKDERSLARGGLPIPNHKKKKRKEEEKKVAA